MAFLWWAFLTVVGVGSGFLINGFSGAVFMAAISVLGAAFLLFEHKFHDA